MARVSRSSPFLHAGLVDERGWLTEQQFVDAVAMGLITPGRVVIGLLALGLLLQPGVKVPEPAVVALAALAGLALHD